VKPDDFTIQTIPERLRHVGDLWLGVRQSVGVNIPELYERWLR
jgi:DNA primase